MHALESLSTEALAAGAQQGSLAHFEELARRFQTPLLHFLMRRVGNRTEAEDLVQETFLRAFKHLNQFQNGRKFQSWIFTIAYNVSNSHARNQAARIQAQPLNPGLSAATPVHESQLLHADLWDVARAVLNDEQFSALWLHYAEQLATSEVAAVLNRSRTGVRVMLFRARRVLERHLRSRSASARLAAMVAADSR